MLNQPLRYEITYNCPVAPIEVVGYT